ncbi:MAG: ATP-binding cassette domain-containing protein, partial [Clostridia bacterium]|nr:ATP-binding cassette domain-containing protein [Clostridia bacterium]
MIKLENISFHYGGEHGTGEGIDNIDLTIEDGEVVVLCGRSGCGKTTLTRVINGLAPQFYEGKMEGKVFVDDLCVTTEPLSKISTVVGSVFQNPKSQFFNMDTTGELVFGCENQGLAREEIHNRLNKTVADMQLDNLKDRNIFELSGGEKQQIACGSVYTANPRVYVLDEPSSNLDKKAIHRLHGILKIIKNEGKTIVVSEHRLHYLMDIADRFIYMDDGRITKIFTCEEIKKLSDDELKGLGLRCTSLKDLKKTQENELMPKGLKPVIEATDIACNKGGNKILDIERMALPKNSIVALIGDNGSGKSTLSESLCGVVRCDGSVAFEGDYLTDKQRYGKSFMVMQDVNRQLFSESVIDEVMLNSSVSQKEADVILDDLDLLSLKERHPASLSGGQKQRVAICSALCAGKDIIFYDEPTSGLDRGGMERFGALLRRMQSRMAASVIITHDMELILQCCTHVLHIENGRIASFYPLDDEGVNRIRYYFLSKSDESTSKKREKISSLGRIMRYATGYKKYTYIAAVLMIIGAVASVLPFLSVYKLVNSAVLGETITLKGSAWLIGSVLIFEALYALFYTYGLKFSHIAAYGTLENIRKHLQSKMEMQAIGDVQEMGTGAIKKLFIDDIESIELLLAHIIPEGIANVAVPVAAILAILLIDWQLALLTVLMVLFGVSASNQMYTVGMDKMGSYFAASKRLNNTIIEYVNGMEVVRVFNRQGETSKKFADTVYGYRDFALAWYKICWPWMAMYGSIFANIMLYTLPFGALIIILGKLSVSKYVLTLCLSFGIGPLILHIMGFIAAFPQVNYKIQALEKAMDKPPLKTSREAFKGTGGDVCFEDIHFG